MRRTRVLLVALASLAGCADWKSLYRTDPEDAAALDGPAAPDAAIDDDAAPLADGPVPLPDMGSPVPDATASAADAAICADDSGPVVLWRFDGSGVPSPANFISDSACRPPSVPLGWDLQRNAGRTRMSGGWLFFDGGFLESQIKDSDDLGRALVKARSLSIELWFKGTADQTGTIFATRGATSGRAFDIEQRAQTLRFTLHTTATDATGEKLMPPIAPSDGAADLTAHFNADGVSSVHVVATFSSDERAAHLYVDGVLAATVIQGRAEQPMPIPVWASGKNELGLGGTFEGASWHGWVDLAAVYDRALSASEVQALHALGP